MPYAIGALGAVLFVLVFLIDRATRPGYSPGRHTVSALALGPRGWVQRANFVVGGAGISTGAVGLLTSGDHRMLGLILTVFGLGLTASVVPMDAMRGYPPETPERTLKRSRGRTRCTTVPGRSSSSPCPSSRGCPRSHCRASGGRPEPSW